MDYEDDFISGLLFYGLFDLGVDVYFFTTGVWLGKRLTTICLTGTTRVFLVTLRRTLSALGLTWLLMLNVRIEFFRPLFV